MARTLALTMLLAAAAGCGQSPPSAKTADAPPQSPPSLSTAANANANVPPETPPEPKAKSAADALKEAEAYLNGAGAGETVADNK